MKLIKINKALLILAFFMPFTVTMCSRSENWNSKKIEVESGSRTNTPKSNSPNYFSYLLYPTEYSASGFGFTYKSFGDAIQGKFKFEWFQLVPLAFIISILGLIFTFYQKPRLLFYLSLLNLTCFIVLTIIAIWASVLDNSLESLFEFLLWGFWLTLILSVIDVILTKRNTQTISIT